MQFARTKINGAGPRRVQRRSLQHDLLEDLYAYWFLVRTWWRTIIFASAAVGISVLLLTVFFAQRWYQAVAVIEPATEPSIPELMLMGGGDSGLAQTLAGTLLSNSGSGLLGENPMDEEYKSIMHSFEFVTELAKDEHVRMAATSGKPGFLESVTEPVHDWLAKLLPRERAGSGEESEDWSRYREIDDRFDSRYDPETGLMTISFVSQSPADGKTVLQAYINRLRQILGSSRAAQSKQALASLQGEIARTSDNRLREQLYAVAAQEIAQQTAAEAEADYAFKVLSGPVVDVERPYRPRPTLYCVVSGFLTAVLLSLLAFVSHHVSYFKTEFERLESAADDEYRRNGHFVPSTEGRLPLVSKNGNEAAPAE